MVGSNECHHIVITCGRKRLRPCPTPYFHLLSAISWTVAGRLRWPGRTGLAWWAGKLRIPAGGGHIVVKIGQGAPFQFFTQDALNGSNHVCIFGGDKRKSVACFGGAPGAADAVGVGVGRVARRPIRRGVGGRFDCFPKCFIIRRYTGSLT